MRIGIVGLPNAGKSSLFNALTRAGAEAANYPFTTLEPNVAIVPVPDEQLDVLQRVLREGRERWHEVEASDGAVLVDLGQVVYLRVESDEHRVGF